VQAEPLLAARTVAIANSVTYNRAGNDVTNVRAAVQRVGFRTLGALAASVIVRQLSSEITDPALRARADQLWRHSAHVAALAQVIARRVFLPAELPGAPALLAAQASVPLSLRLSISDVGGVPMAGYRALVFYP
jgi:HD-GYP domain-containing protein (c-di-GMP phosphodiesterase class II)